MKISDTLTYRFARQNLLGTIGSTGKVAADFAVTLNGVSQAITALTEIGTTGAWTEYSFTITAPATAGQFSVFIQPASGTDVIFPMYFYDDLQAYDETALANLLLTSQGVPGTQSAADSALGDIVDGDSYQSATLTMPSGKLSPFSITNIAAAGITVEAAIMGTPGGSSFPITAAVVSGPGLTFTFSWTAQQHTALAAGQQTAAWYIDVQVIKTGPPKIIVTTNRYSFNQVWQRDTRTT